MSSGGLGGETPALPQNLGHLHNFTVQGYRALMRSSPVVGGPGEDETGMGASGTEPWGQTASSRWSPVASVVWDIWLDGAVGLVGSSLAVGGPGDGEARGLRGDGAVGLTGSSLAVGGAGAEDGRGLQDESGRGASDTEPWGRAASSRWSSVVSVV